MIESVYKLTLSGLNSKRILVKLAAKVALKFVQRLSIIYDPLVNYSLNSCDIKIPLSHALPVILNQYPFYSSNLARVASCVKYKYDDLSIIDIGANIGDSVFILRKEVFCPILCIEGDEKFFKILQANTIKQENISIKKVFIGNTDEIIEQELVIVAGTAHFEESNTKTTEFKKLSSVLINEPTFSKSKMLKIDTDGFDLSIIRGSVDFIQIVKPVLFFEYDPFFLSKQSDDGISIFSLLQSLGYSHMCVYDNFGDYLISLPLQQSRQIEDIHRYLLGRNGKFYYDICVVHEDDLDIAERLRAGETVFSEQKIMNFAS